MCCLLGYIVGWWWRGVVTRLLDARARRGDDALLSTSATMRGWDDTLDEWEAAVDDQRVAPSEIQLDPDALDYYTGSPRRRRHPPRPAIPPSRPNPSRWS